MAIIADMDGTILESWSRGDYTPHPGPWTLPAHAIMTNQGGVALRWAGFPWARDFYPLATALDRVRAAMRLSGAKVALVSVYSDKQLATWRGRLLAWMGSWLPPIPVGGGIYVSLNPAHHKPNPGGLEWLARRLGSKAIQFVGDSLDDANAARAAGVEFIPVQSKSGELKL